MIVVLTGKQERIVQQALARGEYASAEEMIGNALEVTASNSHDWQPTPAQEEFLMRRLEEVDEENPGRDYKEVMADLRAKLNLV